MRDFAIFALMLLLTAPSFGAGWQLSGTTGANFLAVEADASQAGMCNSGAAAVHGVSAIGVNPAGLANPVLSDRRNEVLAVHAERFLGRYEQLAYVRDFGRLGVFGASIVSNWMVMDGYGPDGTPNPRFLVLDASPALSWAMMLPMVRSLAVGANVRFIYQQLEEYKAVSGAIDLGAQYLTPGFKIWKLNVPPMLVGSAIQNVGLPVKFIEQANMLPIRVKAGAAMPFTLRPGHTLWAQAEGRWLISELPALNVGCEYRFDGVRDLELFIRGGLRTRAEQAGLLSNFTVGAGVSWKTFTLDYAWVPEGDLGLNGHQLSLKAGF